MLRASRNPSDPIHSTTQPSDAFVGMLWVDTDASPATLYICTSISPVTFEVVGPATVASPLTTKGDIWGYSNANSRIPVGSDGKSLVADSTAALGVSYATRVPEAPTDGTAYVRQSAAWVAQTGTGGSGGTSGNFLVNGGGVAWSTGLSLIVSAASYVIQGTSYNSAISTLTLSTADPTNPRIDVIALNTSGAAVIIAGTPAANPEKPDVNPVTQLEISFVYVPAAATVPNVTVTQIYFEGVEWTATRSGTGFTIGSTNNPYAGTKDIEGTSVPTGDYVNFEAPSAFDPNVYDKLVLYIRSKATWDTTRALNLSFRNSGGAQKGVIIALRHGSYGFDSSITSAYQQIVIPVVDFAAGGISCKMLRMTMGGTGTAPGMYLDNIQFQTGLAPSAANLDMRWRGDYDATVAYSTNDAVQYQGVLWVATNNGTGNTPSTSSTFWQDATGPATSSGLSVTGRAANTTGAVADITAANDGEVLRRSGSSVGFGTIATAGVANDAVTYAKIQNCSTNSRILACTTAGDFAEHSLSAVLDFIGSAAQGDILYRDSSGWARLAAGTSGYVLSAAGASANPAWASIASVASATYCVYATADKSKTNDTSLTADPDTALNVTLNANKKYRVEYDVEFNAAAAPDLKYDLNFSGTTTSMISLRTHGVVTTANIAAGTTTNSFVQRVDSAFNTSTFVVAANDTICMKIILKLQVGASGGTLALRWAQDTTSGTAVTRRKEATVLVTEIP